MHKIEPCLSFGVTVGKTSINFGLIFLKQIYSSHLVHKKLNIINIINNNLASILASTILLRSTGTFHATAITMDFGMSLALTGFISCAVLTITVTFTVTAILAGFADVVSNINNHFFCFVELELWCIQSSCESIMSKLKLLLYVFILCSDIFVVSFFRVPLSP